VADFNGDGNPDIMAQNYGNEWRYWEGNGVQNKPIEIEYCSQYSIKNLRLDITHTNILKLLV